MPTKKQETARKRNWEKGRLINMKYALQDMVYDSASFRYKERQQLQGVLNRVDRVLINWVNKR